MGYLVAMEIRVTLFLLMQFFMLYSIGPINVCTDFEINPYKIDEVRKYAKIVFFRHVTSNKIYNCCIFCNFVNSYETSRMKFL